MTIGALLLLLGAPLAVAADAPLAKKIDLKRTLKVIKIEKSSFLLIYSGDTCMGPPKKADRYRFKYEDTKRIKTSSDFIKVSDPPVLVFADGPAAGRFHLKNVVQKEITNPRTGILERVNVATLVDQRRGREGELHEIRKGSRNGLIIREDSVTLTMNVPGLRLTVDLHLDDTVYLPLPGNVPPRKVRFKSINKDGNVVLECTNNDVAWDIVLPAPPN